MNDVGKLLWALMSYIVFVLVHLYLRLSEKVFPCDFHKHWEFLYIARRHLLFIIVVRKTPYFICYVLHVVRRGLPIRVYGRPRLTTLHDGCTIDGLLRVPRCCVEFF